MALELDIESGEIYTIGDGRLEEWRNTIINGSLDLSNGHIALIDNPDESTQPGFGPDTDFNFQPLFRSPSKLSGGMAILLASILALNAWLAVKYKSPAFIFCWALTIIVLVLTILINIPFLWFWICLLVTGIITLSAGVVTYRQNT